MAVTRHFTSFTWFVKVRTRGRSSMLLAPDTEKKEELLRCLERHAYVLDSIDFATGRPDRLTLALRTKSGLPVVAKLYPSGGGEKAYHNMERLWNSSFGRARNPPGLPEPLEYLADASALIMNRLPGQPLVELGRMDERAISESMKLLANLHECDAQPE